MRTFTANQQTVRDATEKETYWLFDITPSVGDPCYFSTVTKTYGGNSYTPKINAETFNGITLNRNRSELGKISPTEFEFDIMNLDDTYTASNFESGTVTLSLVQKGGGQEETMISWKFIISDAKDVQGMIHCRCDDLIQNVLRGYFPTNRFARDIFPSNDMRFGRGKEEAELADLVPPWTIGTGYPPIPYIYVEDAISLTTNVDFVASVSGSKCQITRNSGDNFADIEIGRKVTITNAANGSNNKTIRVIAKPDNDTLEFDKGDGLVNDSADDVTIEQDLGVYLLGSTTPTYTLTEVRSPFNFGKISSWVSGTYTFTQMTVTDGELNNWKAVRPLIMDVDRDGTAESTGIFSNGNNVLPMPIELERSDLSAKTDPCDAAEMLLEAFGVASGDIDATTQASVKTNYTTPNSQELNGSFFTRWSRDEALAMLLNCGNIILDPESNIKFRYRIKTSQETITDADVLTGGSPTDGTSFEYTPTYDEYSDSAEAEWFGYPTEEIPAISSISIDCSTRDKPSGEFIKLSFLNDYQEVQKAGALVLQRKYGKKADVTFLGKSSLIDVQPDDVITINEADYGGNYTVVVDSMHITPDGIIDFKCNVYSHSFDDWGDLAPSAVTYLDDDGYYKWEPVIAGPSSENMGKASVEIWGNPYLVVGPTGSGAKYTDIQDAVNDLTISRHSGIFLLNGIYTGVGVQLHDADIDIKGESEGGVILRNTAGSQMFFGSARTKKYSFSNFTVDSQNSTVSNKLFCFDGDNQVKLSFKQMTFDLYNDDSQGAASGDIGIYALSTSTIAVEVTIRNCKFNSGETAIYVDDIKNLIVETCRFFDFTYADIDIRGCNEFKANNMISEDFWYRSIIAPAGSGCDDFNIKNFSLTSKNLSSGVQQIGIQAEVAEICMIDAGKVKIINTIDDASNMAKGIEITGVE